MVDSDTLMIVMSRWLHVTSGIFWIGLLYYFNVVQVPVFKKFDPAVRSQAIQKLVPVALAWFRYSALATLVFGLLTLYYQGQATMDYLATDAGAVIGAGMLLGLIMFLNVWLVIWPNQKMIIAANREKAATGKDIPPEAAQWAKRAFYASRTNFLLSFPMLFFMVATVHLGSAATKMETMAIGVGVFVVGAVALWLFTSMKPAAQKTGGATPAPPKP